MRLSIVPYLVVVFVSLFLIARRLYTKEAAYLAIFILAFFSPDLYLTRWALHFISCTAFFLLTTGFIIKSVEVGRRRDFALAGFFLGLCYMSYASSFLAAPLIFFYIVVILIKRGVQRPVAVNFLLTAGMFVYTISPLATYALKVENFLVTRVNQIKLINGSWGPYHGLQIISKQTFEVVKNQAVLSIKSLYTDGIGGAGGYLFGNLALFDRLTFLFIVFSLFYFLYKIIKRKDVNSLFLLVIVLATFVAGMVLTIPPPAFQRISLAFPFLCLLIAVTMTDLYRLVVQKQKLVAVSLLLVFASSLLISNGIHFRKILAKDGPDDPDYPQILEYLNQQNERRFYVAAFESYGMGKILFIMSRGRVTAITLPLEEVLAIIPSYQRSSLVILYPTPEAIQKVRERFPQARMVANYQKHALVRIN
jgi:MFS family permease